MPVSFDLVYREGSELYNFVISLKNSEDRAITAIYFDVMDIIKLFKTF